MLPYVLDRLIGMNELLNKNFLLDCGMLSAEMG